MDKANVPAISGKNRYYIGRLDGEAMCLSKPSFDCGWYWGMGYVGNRNCHMHLDGILNEKSGNWFDNFKSAFTDIPESLQDDKNLWKFVETFHTLYTLKEAASVYHIGGSHYTTPVINLKDPVMYEKIVTEHMPDLFEVVVVILENRK